MKKYKSIEELLADKDIDISGKSESDQRLAEARAISIWMQERDPVGFNAIRTTVRKNITAAVTSGTFKRCMKPR